MAKKKKKAEKPPREFTRRQLSQWQRQQRRQRITIIVGISIIVVVVLTVLVGWLLEDYLPMHQTVIRVNDTEFNMKYYIDALAVSLAGEPVENILPQAAGVAREIERNELIRQEALTIQISVSDDEAKETLNRLNIAVNDATLDMVREQLLLNRLRNEYFDNQVPKSAPQVHMMAMLLESERQAYEIRDRLENSGNFTALAEEFSLDKSVQDNKGDFGWHPESIFPSLLGSSVPVEYAFGAEIGALSQPRYDEAMSKPVGYWLVRVLERDDEADAQVQAVLLGSEDEALDIRARLEAGEDLAALAEEFSQSEESQKQGGELGVVSKGEMSPVLDEYIFNPDTELNTWSEPIRDDAVSTQGAYWLVKVMDRDDNRELDSEDRDYLLGKAINEWVTSLWVNPAFKIEDNLDEEKQQWAAERVSKIQIEARGQENE